MLMHKNWSVLSTMWYHASTVEKTSAQNLSSPSTIFGNIWYDRVGTSDSLLPQRHVLQAEQDKILA